MTQISYDCAQSHPQSPRAWGGTQTTFLCHRLLCGNQLVVTPGVGQVMQWLRPMSIMRPPGQVFPLTISSSGTTQYTSAGFDLRWQQTCYNPTKKRLRKKITLQMQPHLMICACMPSEYICCKSQLWYLWPHVILSCHLFKGVATMAELQYFKMGTFLYCAMLKKGVQAFPSAEYVPCDSKAPTYIPSSQPRRSNGVVMAYAR